MQWYKKQIKQAINEQNKIKLGPSFFVNNNKKMMIMTRPIDAYLFGFDQMLENLQKDESKTSRDAVFSNIFSSTLNSLVADILNYFQNRVQLTTGKKIKITSIRTAKAQIKKYLNEDIKNFIGDRGYKELKKLDEIRGNFQHDNDRYFIDYKINKTTIEDVSSLIKYSEKIRSITIELDKKLEEINTTYKVKQTQEPGKTTIEMHALNHSFDLTKMKVNKKDK